MPAIARSFLFTTMSLVLLAPMAAPAQVAVYAMGSGGFVGASQPGTTGSGSNSFNTWGGTFGVYDDFLRLGPLKFGSDFRYFQETSSGNNGYDNKLHGGMGGVRLSLKLPLLPPKPYIQAEVGGVGTNYGVQPDSVFSFAYQVQGGLDFTVFPHLDLRAEYGGGQLDGYNGGNKASLQEAGLGLVVRF